MLCKNGDNEWLRNAFNKSNQTIQYKGQTEWGKDFNRFAGYMMNGISGTMLVAVGSPMLLEKIGGGSLS